jgi:hypothetical protein
MARLATIGVGLATGREVVPVPVEVEVAVPA